MASDDESDRVILFGGSIFFRGVTVHTDETWAYDGNTTAWSFANPSARPSPRAGHAMAYDAKSDRLILFGGYVGMPNLYNDTWAYDLNTNKWTAMAPQVAPSARLKHTMAYDNESDRIILFGGTAELADLNDTWAYDFDTNTWTDLRPGTRPGPRSGHAMAYDAESDRVVLFGGFPTRDDTWSYDVNTNTWTNLNPFVHPSARTGHSMTYDAPSDRVVLFGGENGALSDETWEYNVNANSWEDASPMVRPPALRDAAMSYAPGLDRIVLFGGITVVGGFFSSPSDTWVYHTNANVWTNASPGRSGPGPSGRFRHALAYDTESDRTVLFGGDTGLPNDETWSYDLDTSTWSNENPVPHPSPRWGHVMSYDSESDLVILFGGETTPYVYEYSSETWAYDLNANGWRNSTSPIGPAARRDAAIAYDSESDRVVLFGGYNSSQSFDDTWTYDVDSNTWTKLNPPDGPSARWGHAMVYDAASDRVILFGGYSADVRMNDTWAYDPNANRWTPRPSSSGRPPGRTTHAMAYDANLGRAVLFGGESIIGVEGDTWLYDIDLDVWTAATPTTSPAARYWHSMAYDAKSAQVVLFGGSAGDEETWSYPAIVPLTVPGAPERLDASAADSTIQLAWRPPLYDGGSPVTQYKVYRGTSPGALSLYSNTNGALSLVDNGATNGITYYYEVTAVNALGEGPPSNQVSATPTVASVPWFVPAAAAAAGAAAVLAGVLLWKRRKGTRRK